VLAVEVTVIVYATEERGEKKSNSTLCHICMYSGIMHLILIIIIIIIIIFLS